MMGIALPLRMGSLDLAHANLLSVEVANLIGHSAMSLATASICIFVWRVFRPEESWGRNIALVLIGTQLVAIPALLVSGGTRDELGPVILVVNVTRAIPLFWALFESLRYRSVMRRRMSIGLADPVVSNRFTLFSLWTGALGLLPTAAVVLRIHARMAGLGNAEAADSWIMTAMRVIMLGCGVTAAITIWLSFFPPEAYLSRLRAREAAPRSEEQPLPR